MGNKWYTVSALTKFSVFDIERDETVNLEIKTGYKWENPQFITTIIEFEAINCLGGISPNIIEIKDSSLPDFDFDDMFGIKKSGFWFQGCFDLEFKYPNFTMRTSKNSKNIASTKFRVLIYEGGKLV